MKTEFSFWREISLRDFTVKLAEAIDACIFFSDSNEWNRIKLNEAQKKSQRQPQINL